MLTRFAVLTFVVGCLVVPIGAQVPPRQVLDFPQEPFVVERSRVAYRFENDGTGRREMTGRIKVQSDAGVQQFGQLLFGYNASTERMSIDFVRVTKANGEVVTATADAVQELSSPIERDAPVYTDYRQKHVTVPGLRPGETLEFGITITMHTPLAVDQFWVEHRFDPLSVVLEDVLEIDVPAGRAVTLKTAAGYEPAIADTGGRRVYRWRTSQTTPSAVRAAALEEETEVPPAQVRLTTFQNWAEVGRWYAGLERNARASNAPLRAKAQELVAGKRTDLEKLEALYDYVALNFRYVSISLGVGRYQPRAAADVFRDQYGDCKDKHTLLASLMSSVGLDASTVLIHSAADLDPAFPSPSQFNHVITRAEIDGQAIWLDVTTEVAPFRLLSPPLRKKQALVVKAGTGELAETPADPPVPNSSLWSIDGTLGELGTLTARITVTLRGDAELVMRTIFRQVPGTRWKELIEEMDASAGVGGEVGRVDISDPATTRQPFVIQYDVTKVNFVDWTKKTVELQLPLSPMELPEQGDAEDDIELGSPADVQYRLRLELGAGYTARAPVPVDVKRDYGDYRAAYTLSGQTFTAERHLRLRSRELPAGRASDFAAFRRVVSADEDQRVSLTIPASASAGTSLELKSADLLRSGFDALRNGNFDQAIALLRRVVEAEPRHATAWRTLATAFAGKGDVDAAIDALKKQVEINPFDDTAYNALGAAYAAQRRTAEAEAAFLKQLEINPLDSAAPMLLGQLYVDAKRFADAVPHLERAAARMNDNASVHVTRGYAYLNVGREDEALVAFDRALELSPTAPIRNNIAYYLAERQVHLDRAERYAESAVASMSVESRNVSLARVTDHEIRVVNSLATFWDTLGWIAFARGNLARAEQLLTAAWRLAESGVAGDHLAQVYEKQGRRELAIATYAAALSGSRPDPQTRSRLRALVDSDQEVTRLVDWHRSELAAVKTITVPSGGQAGSATFYVLLGPNGVEDVRFSGGDDALRDRATALTGASFRDLLPVADAVPARLVRQGMLSCAPGAATCHLVLLRASDTRPSGR